MFSFFKRLVGTKQTTEPAKRRPKKRKQEARDPSEPIPAPEVVAEGNDHTDWDLWQDSVDSQMQSLSPSVQTYASTMPSELDELDPFAKVGKNRDV